MKVEEIDKRQS